MKTRLLSILLLLILACSGVFATAETYLDAYAWQVIEQTNAERAKYGLPAMAVDPELMAAARIRGLEITQKFSHIRPNGQTGSSVSSAARNENIARGQQTPDKVMAAWLTSPSHRRSLLGSYTRFGVCCVKSGNVYHWVQLFGK